METPAILGFAGDTINFVAAALLAWDPLMRQRVFLKVQADKALPMDVEFQNYRGKTVKRGDDLEKVLVRGETTRTKIAYAMLILGFAALFLARYLEYKSHPAAPDAVQGLTLAPHHGS